MDPAGEATKSAAMKMGVEGIRNLRIGKFIEIELESKDKDDAIKNIEFLSERLFANTVIEDWLVEVDSTD